MFWLTYLMGMLIWGSGFFAGMYFATVKHQKEIKKVKMALDDFMTKSVKFKKSLDDADKKAHQKLNEAIKISQEQYELMKAFDMPSKSASHSKYKNELAAKLKALEEEKCILLQEVLDSGYNPTITVLMDGEKKEIKLEEYLITAGYGSPKVPEVQPPPTPKLRLVKETTDDPSATTPS
jgi:hypothetical protein